MCCVCVDVCVDETRLEHIYAIVCDRDCVYECMFVKRQTETAAGAAGTAVNIDISFQYQLRPTELSDLYDKGMHYELSATVRIFCVCLLSVEGFPSTVQRD